MSSLLKENYYRPELDGLRGISVLCILLYHSGYFAFKKVLPGAFVTLDIFFVISGYLITKGIIIRGENFSYKEFYIRRVKRLFPAMALTIITTFFIGFFLFTPGRVQSMSLTGMMSILPLSNIYFATHLDYFSYDALSEPFIHTWSLSLEEQFYLFYPFLLVLTLKRKFTFRSIIIGFVILSAITIWGAEYYLSQGSHAIYYLLPFRLYQLLAGALINFIPVKRLNYRLSEFGAFTGIAINIYAVHRLNFLDPFPGLNSIFPTLGTFLIIFFTPYAKNIRKIFSNKLLRLWGASSYSIYLYHWPFIVLLKYFLLRELNFIETLIYVLLSLSLGSVSWLFFEKNFLNIEKESIKERVFLKKSGMTFIVIMFLLSITYLNKGFLKRYHPYLRVTKEEVVEKREKYWEKIDKLLSNDPDVLFIGNSHAADLIQMFYQNEAKFKFDFIATTEKCFQFVSPIYPRYKSFCKNVEKEIFNYKNLEKVKKIYLHDYWPLFKKKNLVLFLNNLKKRTDAKIYLFGPKMVYLNSVVDIFHLANLRKINPNILAKENEVKDRAEINELVKTIDVQGVSIIDLLTLQCGERYKSCRILDDRNSKLLYFDDNHFNLLGAKLLGKKIKKYHFDLFK